MEDIHGTLRRRGLAAAALAGGALMIGLGAGATASAGGDAGAAARTATVTMQLKNGKFFFTGSERVRAGSKLRIRNNTDPSKGGPHTFSLVSKSVVPDTRKEQSTCFESGICLPIAMAHEFDEATEKIGRPLVRAGRRGWDRSFTTKRKGDSWYTETDGETFSQKVSARPGRTLRYMCAVHPEMQGKIKVIARR